MKTKTETEKGKVTGRIRGGGKKEAKTVNDTQTVRKY